MSNDAGSGSWFDDYADEQDESQIDEYDLSATPNDFNVLTIYNFIKSGAVKIPGFQRNFVWDIRRSSKLIESLLLGLPVPQVFLYEENRNRFLVIDGQQRLMSIYYFMEQRFPKKEKRSELRQTFDLHGLIPEDVLHDDLYFNPFKLVLTQSLPNRPNKFNGLKYSTLGEYKTQFELRPIRNVIVKQNAPKDDDSSIFEIFNRLNSGGVNLWPQEIRISLYHSEFYNMLYRANSEERWRQLLGRPEPDLHVKDVEVMLRGFAMLIDSGSYAPSMTKFLNLFSQKCRNHTPEQNEFLEDLFTSFLKASESVPSDVFVSERTHRFNVALFEAVFSASLEACIAQDRMASGNLSAQEINELDADPSFQSASLLGTTRTTNVETRLNRARALISSL